MTAVLPWPLVARVQQPERVRRIDVLMAYAESDPEGQALVAAFREGLQTLGRLRAEIARRTRVPIGQLPWSNRLVRLTSLHSARLGLSMSAHKQVVARVRGAGRLRRFRGCGRRGSTRSLSTAADRPLYSWTGCYIGVNMGGGAAPKSSVDTIGKLLLRQARASVT